jgi:hypothetical protein
MAFRARVAAAAVAAALVLSPALAAENPLASKISGPIETVGPAAKGDKKPYHAVAQALCQNNACVADFGKKGNKVRTIEWVSCGIATDNGVLQIGRVFSDSPLQPIAFVPAVSRGISIDDEIALLEFDKTFRIPAGEALGIEMFTSGTAVAGQCIVSGTIE